MARPSLAEVAGSLAGEVSGDDPQERAAALVRRIRSEHPDRDWKTRSIQNAAARAVGAESPGELESRAAEVDRPRRRRGRRMKTPRIRVAPASSFGAIFSQMLGLVLLYWAIRSAGAVNVILDRVGSAVRWFIEPVGWGRSRSN